MGRFVNNIDFEDLEVNDFCLKTNRKVYNPMDQKNASESEDTFSSKYSCSKTLLDKVIDAKHNTSTDRVLKIGEKSMQTRLLNDKQKKATRKENSQVNVSDS